MNILEIVTISLIGGLVVYLICLTCWIMELSREAYDIQMEINRIMAKLEALNGNMDEAEIEPQETEET